MGAVKEMIFYLSDQSDNRTAIEANIGETYGITEIPAANDTVNGFLQTWYDQSGSGNDAVQISASSQPKIVGEVTSGQPHAFLEDGIYFDGTDDYLEKVSFSLSQAFTIFSLSNTEERGKENMIVAIADSYVSGIRPLSEYYRVDNGFAINAGSNHLQTLTTAPSTQFYEDINYIKTSLFNGSSSEIFVDGASKVIGYAGSNNPSGNLYIGGMSNPTPAGGAIQEIIIYDSDQSSNRPAIEANIANQYGITLS
jgi:hypothetical protein